MTVEESAIERFQDEPYFEVLIQSITRKAARYAFARIYCNKTLGAGNTVDCIIRDETFKEIAKLANAKQS